jgi:hypothetical protein
VAGGGYLDLLTTSIAPIDSMESALALARRIDPSVRGWLIDAARWPPKRFPQVTVLVVDDRLAPACRCPSVGTERKHKMRESKLLGIAGFVALAAILAVEGFGISGSGSSNMNHRLPSSTIMSASYNHAK